MKILALSPDPGNPGILQDLGTVSLRRWTSPPTFRRRLRDG
jgi:hypothetical protein